MFQSTLPIKKDKINDTINNKLLITNDTEENITVHIIAKEWFSKLKINVSVSYMDMVDLGIEGTKAKFPVQIVNIPSKFKRLVIIETYEVYCSITRIGRNGSMILGDQNILRQAGREWIITDKRIGHEINNIIGNDYDSDKEYNSDAEDSDEDCDENQESSMANNIHQSILPTKSNCKLEFINESDHSITIQISPKTIFKNVSVNASVGYSGFSAGIEADFADPLDTKISLQPKQSTCFENKRLLRNKTKVYCSIFRQGPYDRIIFGDHNVIRKTGSKWIIRNDRCGFDLTPGQIREIENNLPKLYKEDDKILSLDEI